MALYIVGLLVSWALACVALGLVAVFLSDKAMKLNDLQGSEAPLLCAEEW